MKTVDLYNRQIKEILGVLSGIEIREYRQSC